MRREPFTPASLPFSDSPRRNWSLNKRFVSYLLKRPRTAQHHKQDWHDPQDRNILKCLYTPLPSLKITWKSARIARLGPMRSLRDLRELERETAFSSMP